MHAEFTGFLQDVVVNIGHVSHTTSLVAQVSKATLQDVEGQIDLGVAQVGCVVRSNAARIESDERPRLNRKYPLSRGVEEFDSHSQQLRRSLRKL